MRYKDLFENKSKSVIVVDVQPEYSGINDGADDSLFDEIISFVNNQTGKVLMFVNAEDTGVSGDSISDIKLYWEDSGFDPNNWDRVSIEDKGYGYFRSWMDNGISDKLIISIIRLLYQHKVNDSRMLFEDNPEYLEKLAGHEFAEWMIDDPIMVEWASLKQLKQFEGSYLVGGGRNECLREVELLMNAFNIKYKRIDSLIYG